MERIIEYKLAPWSANFLTVCVALMFIILAIWMIQDYRRDNMKKAIKLEKLKAKNRSAANDEWQEAYLMEKRNHQKDINIYERRIAAYERDRKNTEDYINNLEALLERAGEELKKKSERERKGEQKL